MSTALHLPILHFLLPIAAAGMRRRHVGKARRVRVGRLFAYTPSRHIYIIRLFRTSELQTLSSAFSTDRTPPLFVTAYSIDIDN